MPPPTTKQDHPNSTVEENNVSIRRIFQLLPKIKKNAMTPTNNLPTAALWYNPIQKQFLKIQLGDGSNLNDDTDANGREYDAYTLLGIFGCPAELEEAAQKGQLEGEIDIDQELELNGIDCPLLKDGGMQLWFKEEMPAIDSEEMLRTLQTFTTEEYNKKSFKKCSFID
jgi:hypothetical protein